MAYLLRKRVKTANVPFEPIVDETDPRLTLCSPFRVKVLSDKIFDMMVSSSDIEREFKCAARAVSKQFLREITVRFWKFNLPYYCLKLDEPSWQVEIPNDIDERGGSQIKRFVKLMKPYAGVLSPPIKITICCNFFRHYNREILVKFLQSELCETRLIHLVLHIPRSGGSMPFLFRQISLESLKSLTVKFLCNEKPGSRYPYDYYYYMDPSAAFVPFIDMLIKSSPKLDGITFGRSSRGMVPVGFDLISLPEHLTKLEFNRIGYEATQLVRNNSLGSLKSLTLDRVEYDLSDRDLFRAINRVKNTLQSLRIKNASSVEMRQRELCLPEMPHLTNCDIAPFNVKLGTVCQSMETFAHSLTRMRLHILAIEALSKVPGNKVFPTVKCIVTSGYHDGLVPEEVTDREMKIISNVFPNLESCELIEREFASTALHFIFEKMTHLVRLVLVMNAYPEYKDCKFWDALLTGVPRCAVDSLKSGITVDVQRRYKLPSLRNMSRLRHLELYAKSNPDKPSPCPRLISDLAFRHGFLQIPTLRTLELGGRFRPSPIMYAELGFKTIKKDGVDKAACYFYNSIWL